MNLLNTISKLQVLDSAYSICLVKISHILYYASKGICKFTLVPRVYYFNIRPSRRVALPLNKPYSLSQNYW